MTDWAKSNMTSSSSALTGSLLAQRSLVVAPMCKLDHGAVLVAMPCSPLELPKEVAPVLGPNTPPPLFNSQHMAAGTPTAGGGTSSTHMCRTGMPPRPPRPASADMHELWGSMEQQYGAGELASHARHTPQRPPSAPISTVHGAAMTGGATAASLPTKTCASPARALDTTTQHSCSTSCAQCHSSSSSRCVGKAGLS